MILTKSCNYGLRAAVYVAAYGDGRFVPIREISEALGVSFHFLTKALQGLNQHQILTSSRGPKGGVALARPAEAISVREVVLAVDGDDLFERCVLGLDRCGDDHPCPLHGQWKGVKAEMERIFTETNLRLLAERMKGGGMRLADLGGASITERRTIVES